MSETLSNFANTQITAAEDALAKGHILPETAENVKNIWGMLEDNENAVREAIMHELWRMMNTRYNSSWDELMQEMAETVYRALENGEKIEDQRYNFFLFDKKGAKNVLENLEELLFIEVVEEERAKDLSTDFEDIELPEAEELTEEEQEALEDAMRKMNEYLYLGADSVEADLREANTRHPLAFDLELDNLEIIGEFEIEDGPCGDPTISHHWENCPRYTDVQKVAIDELLENVVILRLLYNELRPQEIYGLPRYSKDQAADLVNRLGSIADMLEGDYFSEPIFIINDKEITEEIEYRD
jgi:hypothetical protein